VRYLLDTNIVIDLLRKAAPKLDRRLFQHSPADIAVSSIVMHELYYGAFKSARSAAGVAAIDSLNFSVIELDRDDARHAGEIRAILMARGTSIGPFDVLIAGQARARDLILVTRNLREFARVPGLRSEDWHS
jgi:tRNA(fMet)-specific endonuclease VapC